MITLFGREELVGLQYIIITLIGVYRQVYHQIVYFMGQTQVLMYALILIVLLLIKGLVDPNQHHTIHVPC